jgi:hypothetical protein
MSITRAATVVAATLAITVTTWIAPASAATLAGWERCVVKGANPTKPGDVCIVRVYPTKRGVGWVEYRRKGTATSRWEFIGVVSDARGRYVGDLVRRPR